LHVAKYINLKINIMKLETIEIFKTIINYNTGLKTKEKIKLIGVFSYDKHNFETPNKLVYIFDVIPSMRRIKANKSWFDKAIYSYN